MSQTFFDPLLLRGATRSVSNFVPNINENRKMALNCHLFMIQFLIIGDFKNVTEIWIGPFLVHHGIIAAFKIRMLQGVDFMFEKFC